MRELTRNHGDSRTRTRTFYAVRPAPPRAGQGEASLDELFDLWRHENPSDELYAENVAAIAASIEDFQRGEIEGWTSGDDFRCG